MQKKKKLKTGWKLLLTVIICASVLLMVAVAPRLISGVNIFTGTGIRLEVASAIVALVAAITVMLVVLLIALISTNGLKKRQRRTAT